MKFVYFVILGLLIFNGVLVLTADIFDTGLEGSATDVVDDYGTNFTLSNSTSLINVFFGADGISGLTAGVVVLSVSMAIALITKNYVVIAIGMFLGLVTAMYVNVSSVLYKIDGNPYIIGIITLVGIAIGLLVLYNLVEMFTGQGGDV